MRRERILIYVHNWFDQAYLFAGADGYLLERGGACGGEGDCGKVSYVRAGAADSKVSLKPGEKCELVRRIYPADHPLGAKGEMLKASGAAVAAVTLNAKKSRAETAPRSRFR